MEGCKINGKYIKKLICKIPEDEINSSLFYVYIAYLKMCF